MGLREILVVFIVLAVSVTALLRPRIGLYGYLWWALMRPDLLAFIEGRYPFSLLLAIATGIGTLRYLGRIPVLWENPISRILLLLQVPFGLSVVFAITPELTYDRYTVYIRMILVLFLIPILIETEQHLRELLLVMALSLGFIALKFGVYGVIHGGVELAAGYGDMLADNNFVALAFATIIPLCWYCRYFVESKWLKLLLLGIVGSSIAAIVMSNSRGSVLSMCLGLLLIFRSTKRKVAAVLVLGLALGGAIYLVQDMFTDRMGTLADYQNDGSAESRIVLADAALQIWQQHPILGVGFGSLNFSALATRLTGEEKQLVAHNTYVQLLVDSGVFALLFYASLVGYTVYTLGRSASFWKATRPDRAATSRAIQIPIIVFSLGSTFYSCYRMDLPYMFLMCGAVWYSISRRCAEEEHATDLETEQQGVDEESLAIARSWDGEMETDELLHGPNEIQTGS